MNKYTLYVSLYIQYITIHTIGLAGSHAAGYVFACQWRGWPSTFGIYFPRIGNPIISYLSCTQVQVLVVWVQVKSVELVSQGSCRGRACCGTSWSCVVSVLTPFSTVFCPLPYMHCPQVWHISWPIELFMCIYCAYNLLAYFMGLLGLDTVYPLQINSQWGYFKVNSLYTDPM